MLAVVPGSGKCVCSEAKHTSVAAHGGRIFAVAAAVAASLAEEGAGTACAVVLRHSGDHKRRWRWRGIR
jgi:hypothetical protein